MLHRGLYIQTLLGAFVDYYIGLHYIDCITESILNTLIIFLSLTFVLVLTLLVLGEYCPKANSYMVSERGDFS